MASFLSILTAMSVIVGADGGKKVIADAARMEGVWRFDSIEVDGAPKPASPFDTNKVIILKNGRFVIMQGAQYTHGTMTIDETKSPREYDSKITTGVAKGLTFACIYELSDDTYKLCGSYRGGPRPSEFKTSSGSGLVMQVLKREKQSVPDALLEVARKELAGTWSATSCTHDGKAESEETTKKLAFAWDADGKITGHGADEASVAAYTKIDAVADPMTIDVSYTDGNMKSQTALGVATIDGDSLTICYAAPGKPRPTELKSDPGSGNSLVTYHREPAEKK